MDLSDSFPGFEKNPENPTSNDFPIKCNLCNNPPRNVVETECCGALYCWECVFKTTTCVCAETISPEMCREAKAIQKLLVSTRQNVPAKVDTVPCPEGCGEHFIPADLEEHIGTACPRAQIACECMTKLKRGELMDHMQNECPMAIVDCPFGCVDVLMRRDMEEHLHDCRDAHMEGMLKQLKEQRELIKRLLEQNHHAPASTSTGNRKSHAIWYLLAVFVCFLLWPQAVIFVGLLYFLIDRYAKEKALQCAAQSNVTSCVSDNNTTTTTTPACSPHLQQRSVNSM